MHHDPKADCLYGKTYLNQILILVQILIMFMGNKAIDGRAVRVNGLPSVDLYCSCPLTGLHEARPTDINLSRMFKDWHTC